MSEHCVLSLPAKYQYPENLSTEDLNLLKYYMKFVEGFDHKIDITYDHPDYKIKFLDKEKALSDWKIDALELAKGGLSWRKISERLGIPKTTCSDYLRKIFKEVETENKHSSEVYSVRKGDKVEHDNSRILLISDMHIPYHHPDTIAFLAHLKKKYNPTRVICVGDEVDHHALSFHDSDPDLPSAGDELAQSILVIAELFKMFPKMDILESNHGSLVWRKAKVFGIPKHYIKSYNDVLGVDSGWKWSFDLTVDLPNGQKCYMHHGKTSNIIQLSQQMGMNALSGHFHEKYKIDYWGNSTGLFWGMSVGCLIDDDKLAFNYNNVNIKRPIIGTGLIINSLPVLEPMVLDSGGRWVGH